MKKREVLKGQRSGNTSKLLLKKYICVCINFKYVSLNQNLKLRATHITKMHRIRKLRKDGGIY